MLESGRKAEKLFSLVFLRCWHDTTEWQGSIEEQREHHHLKATPNHPRE